MSNSPSRPALMLALTVLVLVLTGCGHPRHGRRQSYPGYGAGTGTGTFGGDTTGTGTGSGSRTGTAGGRMAQVFEQTRETGTKRAEAPIPAEINTCPPEPAEPFPGRHDRIEMIEPRDQPVRTAGGPAASPARSSLSDDPYAGLALSR